MPNMSLKKNEMPAQDPGGAQQELPERWPWATPRSRRVDEAQRCLHCKNKPCVSGCPVGINIPDFIAKGGGGGL